MEPELIKELRMMIMIVMKKMNIHILLSKNEPSFLTLDAGNEFLDEQDQWQDSLFINVKLEKNQFLKIHIFDKIGIQNSIIKRIFSEWDQIVIVFCMVMMLFIISGCRNPKLSEMDKYVAMTCRNSKAVLTFLTGLTIVMIFTKNMRRKAENKKLKKKRKEANIQ